MSDFPGPHGQGGGQDAVQPPPEPYPSSAPTQFNPQINPPPWQGQPDAPGPGLPQAPPVTAYGYTPYGGQPVPAGLYLDQESTLMLPQGTVLANPGRRIGAGFLAIPLAIITLGIGYVIWGLIVWGSGTTPALQVLGMKCWRPETRQVASWGTMALRETIGRIVESILGVTSIISFAMFLTGKEHRPWHDSVAGTVVLHDPNKVLNSQ
jgi:uncharacterized RDD family membrane protein YckC